MDDSFHIEKGITRCRETCFCALAELGLPAGTEALDPIMPQYLSELITWNGHRPHEPPNRKPTGRWQRLSTRWDSERHGRRTIGSINNALQSVRHPHHFLGITQQDNRPCFHPRQHACSHRAARGGGRVNYDA